jgi:hypothetical protein
MDEKMSYAEMLVGLEREWDILGEGEQAYLISRLAHAGYREVVPYLLRHLKSNISSHRWRALSGLAELKCQEYRQNFVDFHLNDPDKNVRQKALFHLSNMFRGEKDVEILRLALAAWDNPASSASMRLTAGAVMMYQLGVPHDERGAPAWWNEEEEDLQHPSILQAVQEARQLLTQAEQDTLCQASNEVAIQ